MVSTQKCTAPFDRRDRPFIRLDAQSRGQKNPKIPISLADCSGKKRMEALVNALIS